MPLCLRPRQTLKWLVQQVNGKELETQEIYGTESTSDLDCVICLTVPKNTAALPCRHLCMCNNCAKLHNMQSNTCPICRSREGNAEPACLCGARLQREQVLKLYLKFRWRRAQTTGLTRLTARLLAQCRRPNTTYCRAISTHTVLVILEATAH